MHQERTIVVFDTEESHENLLPLSFTRPICDFRIGITTLREKIEAAFNAPTYVLPVEYLRDKFTRWRQAPADALYVAGNMLITPQIAEEAEKLSPGEALTAQGQLVAFRGTREAFMARDIASSKEIEGVEMVKYVFDVFRLNPEAVRRDFERLTAGRETAALPPGNMLIGGEEGSRKLFIEDGASIEGAIINVKDGPVYIGRDSVIMEGAAVRGPLALCNNAKIRMGARIYGGSTFGPYCKVGGEIDNAVFFGFSNKAHDGYLGNAVVGEWCNIGAGTNASNLKNDYSKIRVWNYAKHTFMRTDLQFCGLIMGDHSKIGVNCMLNTATVLGVGVNLHGSGFPRVFVPSFSEGSPAGGFKDVPLKKFCEIAERVMSRRGLELTDQDRKILERVREVASRFKG